MEEKKRVKKPSQFPEIVRRFKKNKLAVMGFLILVMFILVAIFAGAFGTYEESIKQDIPNKLLPPSAEHWFGTDNIGRDVFLRCVYGTRTSLIVAICGTAISLLLGCIVGMSAGYYGGVYDTVIMRVMDIISSIPSILFCIVFVAAFGSNTMLIVLSLGWVRTPAFARIARSSTLKVSGQEYIEAARSGGVRISSILRKHVLPNILGPLIVQATTNVTQNIHQIASLSFLGLGIPAPMPEWGAIISGGKAFLRTSAYLVYLPGLCIILASLGINFVGDGLRDALDPRLKN